MTHLNGMLKSIISHLACGCEAHFGLTQTCHALQMSLCDSWRCWWELCCQHTVQQPEWHAESACLASSTWLLAYVALP